MARWLDGAGASSQPAIFRTFVRQGRLTAAAQGVGREPSPNTCAGAGIGGYLQSSEVIENGEEE